MDIFSADFEKRLSDAVKSIYEEKAVDFPKLEKELDRLFLNLDIDVEFTKHFKDRVKERGLSEKDIMDLMRKVYDKYSDELDKLKGGESRVFTDLTNLVDIVGSMDGYGEDYLRDLNLITAYKSIRDERLNPHKGSPRLTVKEEANAEPFDRLEYYRTYYANLSPSTFNVECDGDAIRISNITGDSSIDIHSHRDEMIQCIGELIEFMLGSTELTIIPLPEITFRHDKENGSKLFGPTAYYEPNKKEIVLYTANRHGKDILRSFCHEMIHHSQNLEDRLHMINTTDVNEDDRLAELEKEAYLKGNMTFRSWENSRKVE